MAKSTQNQASLAATTPLGESWIEEDDGYNAENHDSAKNPLHASPKTPSNFPRALSTAKQEILANQTKPKSQRSSLQTAIPRSTSSTAHAIDSDDDASYIPSSTSNESSMDAQQVPGTAAITSTKALPKRFSKRISPGILSRFGTNTSEQTFTAPKASDTGKLQSALSTSETKRRRTSKPALKASTTAEPDFIMPAVYEGSLGGSWLGEDNPRSPRKETRSKAKIQAAGNSNKKLDACQNSSRAFKSGQITSSAEFVSFTNISRSVWFWVYDIGGDAFKSLKKPLSYILAAYLFLVLLQLLWNFVTGSITSALSPLCRIPGVVWLDLPICPPIMHANGKDADSSPVKFNQLINVQAKFDSILEESAGRVSLPLDMKRGEAAIRDLRHVVRHSTLRSRNELVLEFDGFIETARITSYDLQKFNSHIGRSVDHILATARWTKRILDGIRQRDASAGAIGSFFKDKLLRPFQPIKFTEDGVRNQYIQHTQVLEDEIHRLVAEAQALLLILQNLEDRLDVIHGITVRDDVEVQTSRAEVLSQLWTALGGNREELGKYNSQLQLLSQINTYRQSAFAHVSGTIIKLQEIGAELEELRERVGSVELLRGMKRVPLSVHIEHIELGVERLEDLRSKSKGIEKKELKKKLGFSKGEFQKISDA